MTPYGQGWWKPMSVGFDSLTAEALYIWLTYNALWTGGGAIVPFLYKQILKTLFIDNVSFWVFARHDLPFGRDMSIFDIKNQIALDR